jgi:hypothetical protein
VAGFCVHGDEPSGSIKFGEFLDYLSVLLASQEGLCSMELVRGQLGGYFNSKRAPYASKNCTRFKTLYFLLKSH